MPVTINAQNLMHAISFHLTASYTPHWFYRHVRKHDQWKGGNIGCCKKGNTQEYEENRKIHRMNEPKSKDHYKAQAVDLAMWLMGSVSFIVIQLVHRQNTTALTHDINAITTPFPVIGLGVTPGPSKSDDRFPSLWPCQRSAAHEVLGKHWLYSNTNCSPSTSSATMKLQNIYHFGLYKNHSQNWF